MRKKVSFTIITVIITIATILFIISPLISNTGTAEIDKNFTIRTIYPAEEQYFEYITQKISFKDISFKVITIVRGDNFWKIAKNFEVNIDTLIGANPYWESLLARVDQKIVIPSEKGTLHFVSSLDEIALLPERYNTKKENIIVEELPFLYKYYSPFWGKKDVIAVFIKDVDPDPDFMTASLSQKYRLNQEFRSPLGGRLSSFFGSRRHPIFNKRHFHNGIDIAVRYGTAVGASRGGRVISAGWMGGYGKAVVIQHKDGYKTLYGHLSRITTRRGRYVKKGGFIGRAGSTGWSTGPHLHFTLWHRGKLLNPLKVLW